MTLPEPVRASAQHIGLLRDRRRLLDDKRHRPVDAPRVRRAAVPGRPEPRARQPAPRQPDLHPPTAPDAASSIRRPASSPSSNAWAGPRPALAHRSPRRPPRRVPRPVRPVVGTIGHRAGLAASCAAGTPRANLAVYQRGRGYHFSHADILLVSSAGHLIMFTAREPDRFPTPSAQRTDSAIRTISRFGRSASSRSARLGRRRLRPVHKLPGHER